MRQNWRWSPIAGDVAIDRFGLYILDRRGSTSVMEHHLHMVIRMVAAGAGVALVPASARKVNEGVIYRALRPSSRSCAKRPLRGGGRTHLRRWPNSSAWRDDRCITCASKSSESQARRDTQRTAGQAVLNDHRRARPRFFAFRVDIRGSRVRFLRYRFREGGLGSGSRREALHES